MSISYILGFRVQVTLVDLGPEAVLEDLLGLLQPLVVLEAVQVGKHPHHLRKPVHLHIPGPLGSRALSSDFPGMLFTSN